MARYLKADGDTVLSLPEYATKPGFKWDLKVLLKENAKLTKLEMNPSRAESVLEARKTLKEHGRLDPRWVE